MPDPRSIELLENEEFLSDLRGEMSQRAIALKWDISSATANKWRNRLIEEDSEAHKSAGGEQLKEDFDRDEDGNLRYQIVADRILPLSWWISRLREDGYDPDDFTYSHSNSVWTQHTRAQVTKTLYANKFSATLRRRDEGELLYADVLNSVVDVIKGWSPTARRLEPMIDATLVVGAADFQLGKSDIDGGTTETVARIMASVDAIVERLELEQPSELLLADVGDIIENLFNVSSQRSTNDLGLPGQVEAAVRIMLDIIKRVAPLVPSVIYAAVPSNHGRSRVGYKAEAGDAHDDYGIAIAQIVRTALSLNSSFDHVKVIIPEKHLESMSVITNGTNIGLVHGHQAGAPARMDTWWAGQALGRGPVANSDLLLVGHWHHFNIFTTGDDRHIIVCPSSDPGSAWVTNLKGHRAGAGMVTFLTKDGKYEGIRIV